MSLKMSLKNFFDSDEGKMRVEMRVERELNCKFNSKYS